MPLCPVNKTQHERKEEEEDHEEGGVEKLTRGKHGKKTTVKGGGVKSLN